MEPWGADLYGNPCEQCGFDWSLTAQEAIDHVADMPRRFTDATSHACGDERAAGWSIAAYTSHVADNLRMWAERVQASRLDGQDAVGGYDPDELAAARGYDRIPLRAALWSLGLSCQAWCQVLSAALQEDVTLMHATRGAQRAQDIARNNCHDAAHHLWDIESILRAHRSPAATSPTTTGNAVGITTLLAKC